ncbi:ABC transporter ATP-binding protein [Saccharibacillus sacchari]|uniref:ABC transporter ATP-binding protein n=1 Tax=Saccharibacillus sacchari TaxID=456493 RepID=A0ACC6P8U4_9BACL
MSILTLSQVSKSFGGHPVVHDLSFSVRERSIFGFIGQNGAGKTTTMKMILGLLPADQGEIKVNGERVLFGQTPTNRHIGYLSDVPEFYGFMTAIEYLALCGKITGMTPAAYKRKSAELLELVGLKKIDQRIQGFSRGMKQRLGIAQALLNDPLLLICDEPTSALDPVGRKEVLELLLLVKNHTTVVFSTHILSDVERICDELAFLHKGRIVSSGTLRQIKESPQHSGLKLELEFDSENDRDRFKALFPDSLFTAPRTLRLDQRMEADMLDILRVLTEHQLPVRRIEKLEHSLEDLFTELVRE